MWSNYLRGTSNYYNSIHKFGGINLISGNVPQGAGLSSSASFEIAILKGGGVVSARLDGVKAALLANVLKMNLWVAIAALWIN